MSSKQKPFSRSDFAERALREFEVFLENLDVRILAFDTNQATIAFDAYRRFGKGSGHPAQLNLGDCAAYALARSLNLPLLFKGNDFIHTDVQPALQREGPSRR